MSDESNETETAVRLRRRALTRLTGRSDAGAARANSASALSALHELASSPSTAGEALTLLHELQVHQVEIELQDEELRRSQVELEGALARYVQLYDLAPFAYFSVDADTAIYEVNLAGARLLGAGRNTFLGRRLDQLLTPESGRMLHAMLAQARQNAVAGTVTLHLASNDVVGALQARASADSVSGRFLLAIMDGGAAA